MRRCTHLELQRQMLHHQRLISPAASVAEAVSAMLGCRGAEGTTPYLSLLWRVRSFTPSSFDNAVHQERSLLRVRGPRGTYYWVTRDQAPIFWGASPAEPLPELLSAWGMTEREFEAIADAVTQAVSGHLIDTAQLKRSVPAALQRPVQRKGYALSTSLAVTIEALQQRGTVTLLKEPGFERHAPAEYHGDGRDRTRPNLVGLVAERYPDLATLDGREARSALLRAYIGTFGPVTLEDVAWWTGWPKRLVRAEMAALQREVAEVTVEGLSATYWIHRDAWAKAADAPVPGGSVWLLPGGDSLLKGYTRFERFQKGGHDQNVLRFMPAVLLDGLGAGNWAYRATDDHLDVIAELFEALPAEFHQPLQGAAEVLGRLYPGRRVRFALQVRNGPWHPRAPFPGAPPHRPIS